MLYLKGWGVPQDPHESIKHFAMAAAMGDDGAISNLRGLAAAGAAEAAAALRRLRLAPS